VLPDVSRSPTIHNANTCYSSESTANVQRQNVQAVFSCCSVAYCLFLRQKEPPVIVVVMEWSRATFALRPNNCLLTAPRRGRMSGSSAWKPLARAGAVKRLSTRVKPFRPTVTRGQKGGPERGERAESEHRLVQRNSSARTVTREARVGGIASTRALAGVCALKTCQ